MPARDISTTKAFFSKVFGWKFSDFGSEYSSFVNEGMDGGFYQSELTMSVERGGALVVLYSQTLEQTQAKIEAAGGQILKPIFSFPGGRRFHFADPNGNEFAVWSE